MVPPAAAQMATPHRKDAMLDAERHAVSTLARGNKNITRGTKRTTFSHTPHRKGRVGAIGRGGGMALGGTGCAQGVQVWLWRRLRRRICGAHSASGKHAASPYGAALCSVAWRLRHACGAGDGAEAELAHLVHMCQGMALACHPSRQAKGAAPATQGKRI